MTLTKAQSTILQPSSRVALTDGSTISWNVDVIQHAFVTLGGNRTIAAPTGGEVGKVYVLELKQDPTGSRTVTWNAIFKFNSGVTPTLSIFAASSNVFYFYFDGTNYRAMVYDDISTFAGWSGNWLSFVMGDGTVKFWDSTTWEEMADGADTVAAVPFTNTSHQSVSPDGSQIFYDGGAVSLANTDRLYDINGTNATGADLTIASTTPGTSLGGAVWSPDGTRVAVLTDSTHPTISNHILILETTGWTTVGEIKSTHASTDVFYPDMMFSPDSSKLVITMKVTGVNELYMFTVATVEASYPTVVTSGDWTKDVSDGFSDVIFNDAGTEVLHLVGTSWPNGLVRYNASTGASLGTIASYNTNGLDIAVSSSYIAIPGTAVSFGSFEIVQVFNTALTKQSHANFLGSSGDVGIFARFSADGAYLAVVMSNAPYIKVYRTADWSLVTLPTLSSSTLGSVAFNH